MAERLKAHAWKACVRESVPWVRIPLPPPTYALRGSNLMKRSSILANLLLLLATAASAQDIGDATRGRQLAETWCSSCHIVGPTTARGTSNGAPTFAAVASMSSTTPMSLHAFLVT